MKGGEGANGTDGYVPGAPRGSKGRRGSVDRSVDRPVSSRVLGGRGGGQGLKLAAKVLSASSTFDSGKIHIDLSWIGTATFGPGICQLESWERATKYETCREFFLSLFLSSREIDTDNEGRLKRMVRENNGSSMLINRRSFVK